MINILQVDKNFQPAWDNFVKTNAADGGILQSWVWGDFQKSLDRKIFRLAAVDDAGQLQAIALAVQHNIHFDYNYLYLPRGPVVSQSASRHLKPLLAEILKIASVEKSFMVRCDPAWLAGQEATLAGWRRADWEVQPKCSFIIDISKPEADLLAGMKSKARYNLNLAIRKGVIISVSSEVSGVETFWQLMKQTAKRDGFAPHLKEYYKKMFDQMGPTGTIKLFLAQYQNKIIAAHIVSFFGTTATYLHGASADMYRGVMAPYLLQWQSIAEAKQAGCHYFDFGGVNGQTYFSEKWEGITRFKVGFSEATAPTEFIGTHEIIVNPVVYSMYKFAKQIKG